MPRRVEAVVQSLLNFKTIEGKIKYNKRSGVLFFVPVPSN